MSSFLGSILRNTLFTFYPDRSDADKAKADEAGKATHNARNGIYSIEKRSPNQKALVAHRGKPTDAKTDNAANGKDKGKKADNKPLAGNKTLKTGDFSKKEDKRIKAMKAEGKSWKDIAEALNRDKQAVTDHWHKALKADAAGGDAPSIKAKSTHSKKGSSGWTSEQDEQLKKLKAANTKYHLIGKEVGKTPQEVAARVKELDLDGTKKDKKAEKHKETQYVYKAGKVSKKQSKAAKEEAGELMAPKLTMEEWTTIHADGQFSSDELRLIAELMEADRNWNRIAGRFFDRIGRRVSPEDIRDKVCAIQDKA